MVAHRAAVRSSFVHRVLVGRCDQCSTGKTGRDLYRLFARTDSAGNEQIDWERNGRGGEFDAVELPYYSWLILLLGSAGVGGIGVRRAAGWFTVIGIWALNLFCVLLLTFAFCWLWINVVGKFI